MKNTKDKVNKTDLDITKSGVDLKNNKELVKIYTCKKIQSLETIFDNNIII